MPVKRPAALSAQTLTTNPTLRADFPPTAGGKAAAFMARWVRTRGAKGPWSETVSATVAA